MTDREINTGITELDNDLKKFFTLAESGTLEKIKEAIDNKDLPEEKFFDLVKPDIVRVSLALTNEVLFQTLLAGCADASKQALIDAKALAEKHLAGLNKHPSVLGRFKKQTEKIMAKQSEGTRLTLNVISRISPITTFFGIGDKLLPAVRIGFFDKSDRQLLDSSIDWDDLIFLVHALLSVACREFENWVKLIDKNLLDVPNPDQIAKRLVQIEQNLSKLKKIAPAYGIDLDAAAKAVKDEEKSSKESQNDKE